jgi:Zn-dependent M28 family amino/carboxypeptidase
VILAALLVAAMFGLGVPARAERTFDAQRAYSDLVHQCGLGPRVPNSRAHAECARWLARTLYECADDAKLQVFTASTDAGPLALTNIVATFNPKGQKHVLLCAHWDSRPVADRDPEPINRTKPVPGANDGASGVAVLLEIARALKAQAPKERVTIVLFDGEDYGSTHDLMFLGSRHFADAFTGPPVSWAVLLDMVGDRELRIPIERMSQQAAPAVVDRIWSAAEQAGAPAFVREPGPAVLDDHVSLLRKGIPCIDVIDFEYPYWHTAADTVDKCSPDSLGQIGRTILAALAEDGI